MKKTFTINIGYSIFNIEEGAYEALNSYLNSIKTYFSTIDNDSEIIKDFELRIAENFLSKISPSKQCINLIDVKEMIEIMGSLDDFKEIYKDFKYDSPKEDIKTSKLYRDSSNRIIAGVCSGIADYFKIDPIIIRILFFIAVPLNIIVYIIFWIGIPSKDFDPNLRKILYRDKENGVFGGVSKGLSNYLKIDVNIIRIVFVVSLFFGGAGLLFYLLLWFFTKEAKTIGEKMNMSGFNVNLSNIEDFIKKKTGTVSDKENRFIKALLLPFRLIAPLLEKTIYFFVKILKLILFFTVSLVSLLLIFIIIAVILIQFKLMGFAFVDEILGIIPFYFIFVFCLNLLVFIFLLIVLTTKIVFKKSVINRYVFIVIFSIWFILLLINIFFVPSIIIDLHENDTFKDLFLNNFEYKYQIFY
jgi:phage shock protein PspC (stress-responsive transcriptional regulator)